MTQTIGKSLRTGGAIMLLVAALMMVSAPAAQAQASGSVDIDITFSSITILYFYDDVHVNIPLAVLSRLITGDTDGDDPDIADTTFTNPTDATWVAIDDLAVDDTAPSTADAWTPTAINLTISNAWAVRALGAPGTDTDVTVGGTFPETLTHASGAASGEMDVTAAACGGTCTALTPGLFGAAATGDVDLTLDLTAGNGLVSSGTYNGDGAVYTITATTS